MRILILLILFMVLIVPMPTQAAPLPCDESLFSAAGNIALSGAMIEPNHWQLIDLPYTVDYWQHRGKVLSRVVQIKRGSRVVGEAIRYNADAPEWRVCRGGNGWKNYLLVNGG